MLNKNKKMLLALGTIATVIAPVSAVVACGDSGVEAPSATKVNHAEIFGKYVAAHVVGKAPSAFNHFKLPANFPKAPENTHYEFNNNEIYSLTKDLKGKSIDYWTKDIENFQMIPYFDKDKTTFKVKLVADKGYTLTEPLEFAIVYNTELLTWADPKIAADKEMYSVQGPTGTEYYSTVEDAAIAMRYKNPIKFPDPDQKLTIDKNGINQYLNFDQFKAIFDWKDPYGGPQFKNGGATPNINGTFLKKKDGTVYTYYTSVPTGETSNWKGGFPPASIANSKVLQVGHTYRITYYDTVNDYMAGVVLKIKADGSVDIKPITGFSYPSSYEPVMKDKSAIVGEPLKDKDGKPVTADDIVKHGLVSSTFFGDQYKFEFPGISSLSFDKLKDEYSSIAEVATDETEYDNPTSGAPSLTDLTFSHVGKSIVGDKLVTPGFFAKPPTSKTDAPYKLVEKDYLDFVEISTFVNGHETTYKFHPYDKNKDIAHDLGVSSMTASALGVTVLTLERPLSVTDTLKIDGKIIKAKSNWYNTPKDNLGTPASSAVDQADSIY